MVQRNSVEPEKRQARSQNSHGAHMPHTLENALTHTWANVTSMLRSAAGISARLGELLVIANKITPSQLSFLLKEQKRTGEKIGALLVRHGCLSDVELDAMLAMQTSAQDSRGAAKLGSILLALGKITQAQLDEAIEHHAKSGKRMGDFLHEAGYVARADVEHGLHLQRRLQRTALSAVLSLATASVSSLAYSAQPVTTPVVKEVIGGGRIQFSGSIVESTCAVQVTGSNSQTLGYCDTTVAASTRVESTVVTTAQTHLLSWQVKSSKPIANATVSTTTIPVTTPAGAPINSSLSTLPQSTPNQTSNPATANAPSWRVIEINYL